MGLISLLFPNLRGHVTSSAKLCSTKSVSILAFYRAKETKVDDLDIIVEIKKYVLRLKVTMREAIRVDGVETMKHLYKEEFANFFWEASSGLDKIEKLSTADKILNDVMDGQSATVSINELSILAQIVVSNHSVVIDLAYCEELVEFVLHICENALLCIGLEDLKSIHLTVFKPALSYYCSQA